MRGYILEVNPERLGWWFKLCLKKEIRGVDYEIGDWGTPEHLYMGWRKFLAEPVQNQGKDIQKGCCCVYWHGEGVLETNLLGDDTRADCG